MKNLIISVAFIFAVNYNVSAQDSYDKHPNTSSAGWTDLFKADLSNAIFPKGVWTVTDGVFTASKDEAIWSAKAYDNFILDLETSSTEAYVSGTLSFSGIKNNDDAPFNMPFITSMLFTCVKSKEDGYHLLWSSSLS